MKNDVKYLEYRMKRLESTIEFVGGYALLFENEQEEYKRLRAYFLSINKKED
jgi:hypothetical protein